MAVNLKPSRIKQKRFVREVVEARKLTKAFTIGFEWEVPLMPSPQRGSSPVRRAFANKYWFNLHYECGGAEFASPKFQSLGVAKGFARELKNFVKKKSHQFDFEQTNRQACGIHVHIAETNGKVKKADIKRLAVLLYSFEDRDFIWKLSGRANKRASWSSQAIVRNKPPEGEEKMVDWYSRRCRGRGMIRHQIAFGTCEYRLFGPRQETLIPAIEFAHSTWKFIRKFSKTKYYPSLHEYKLWLFKQKGYKELKDYVDFTLITDKKGFSL